MKNQRDGSSAFLLYLSDFPPFRRTAAETRPFHYPRGRSAPRFRLGGAISPPYHVCDTFFSASHFPPNLNLWRTVTVTYPSPSSVTEKSAVLTRASEILRNYFPRISVEVVHSRTLLELRERNGKSRSGRYLFRILHDSSLTLSRRCDIIINADAPPVRIRSDNASAMTALTIL